jgi:hypothetical protein
VTRPGGSGQGWHANDATQARPLSTGIGPSAGSSAFLSLVEGGDLGQRCLGNADQLGIIDRGRLGRAVLHGIAHPDGEAPESDPDPAPLQLRLLSGTIS